MDVPSHRHILCEGRHGHIICDVLCRFHKECVELWESLPDEAKQHPESWAYNHIVMSYVKDGMGILRWPKKESDLKRRIKHIALE